MSFRFYHIINALSLDVALGAGILSLVLGRYLGFRVPVPILLVLVLTVWSIYTVDHLLDAKSIDGRAASFRHRFHQHFYKPIATGLAAVIAVILFLTTQIPLVTVFYGIPVFLGVMAYFVLNRFFKLSFQKEVLISALYVAGVFIGPSSLAKTNIPGELYYLLAQLGLMAWINLLIFGIYEMEDDRQDGLKSTVLAWGMENTAQFMKVLLVFNFILGVAGLLFFFGSPAYVRLQIIFMFMNGVLGTLYFRRETIAVYGLHYRYFGDGIFFMPVAYFWF